MKVLIVDDEAPARDRLAALLAELGLEYTVTGQAGNGLEALRLCADKQVDLVLMDIDMPVMDGLTAARRLAESDTPPAVIFTTAYEEHALAAFDANAVDYLLKPVRSSRLSAALRRAVRPTRAQLEAVAAADQDVQPYVNATYRGGVERIAVSAIIYLHAASKYVEVCHTAGEALIEESLKSLGERCGDSFLRIHRNALINPAYLTGLEKSEDGRFQAVLTGVERRFEVSRRHLASVRRRLKGI